MSEIKGKVKVKVRMRRSGSGHLVDRLDRIAEMFNGALSVLSRNFDFDFAPKKERPSYFQIRPSYVKFLLNSYIF